MLDARTARILAKENEEDIEARRREEMAGHIPKRGHPRGCPFLMEGCVCDMCRFLLYYIDSIVGCYN